MAVGPQGPVAYLGNLAVALDELFNAVLGGTAHGTFSARSWRAFCAGKRWGRCAVAVLDRIVGAGHCERANVREAAVLGALVIAEQATPHPKLTEHDMRALLLAACLALPVTRSGLCLGFDGRVSHRSNAHQPRGYVGLRLSIIRQP